MPRVQKWDQGVGTMKSSEAATLQRRNISGVRLRLRAYQEPARRSMRVWNSKGASEGVILAGAASDGGQTRASEEAGTASERASEAARCSRRRAGQGVGEIVRVAGRRATRNRDRYARCATEIRQVGCPACSDGPLRVRYRASRVSLAAASPPSGLGGVPSLVAATTRDLTLLGTSYGRACIRHGHPHRRQPRGSRVAPSPSSSRRCRFHDDVIQMLLLQAW